MVAAPNWVRSTAGWGPLGAGTPCVTLLGGIAWRCHGLTVSGVHLRDLCRSPGRRTSSVCETVPRLSLALAGVKVTCALPGFSVLCLPSVLLSASSLDAAVGIPRRRSLSSLDDLPPWDWSVGLVSSCWPCPGSPPCALLSFPSIRVGKRRVRNWGTHPVGRATSNLSTVSRIHKSDMSTAHMDAHNEDRPALGPAHAYSLLTCTILPERPPPPHSR